MKLKDNFTCVRYTETQILGNLQTNLSYITEKVLTKTCTPQQPYLLNSLQCACLNSY